LGKVMLYQLSHVRRCRFSGALPRPGDVLNSSGFRGQLKFRFRSVLRCSPAALPAEAALTWPP
ncbi:hypothetical protein GA0115260_108251, partial [Streptomyces sp. MnatMP-M27]|uniref:hypothetical protein n=1 Tax=Streptomyces sp. MnatMP-M27 TaxID=1839768 RepID=UPI00081E1A1A